MGTCNPDELEAVMSVIDNPVKRKIIQKLSEEPAYALQLAKELGLGQQNVNKHLKNMEAEGIIESIEVESPAGPKRKLYTIKKFYSLRINFASNLYSESLKCFDDPNEWSEDKNVLEEFESRLEKISDLRPKSEKLDELNLFISDIEDEVNSIERKLSKLLYLRNLAMREALISMGDLTRQERRVMYRILDQKSTTCEIISEQLDMRETIVDEVIKRLKEKGIKSIEGKN
ncbi:MAG: ArsR/SmtB family transcription factor [Candidatus Jordarchaeum sp.]|uniref:ArsR/SmtB family transcription factor n=1 Tax=Candidatus Jordarchaeum sp. TaxID=2823881 RepID=UPI00404A3C4F